MGKTKFEYLPKDILKSKEMTSSEKIIYLHLFHISGWEEAKIINKSQIAEKLGIERKTVTRAFSKLEFLNLITINPDNTFKLYLNGIEFTNRNFMKNSLANKMLGDFIKIPTQFLYDTNLTPAERIIIMALFDFYFTIDSKGYFINRANVVFKSIAKLYNISEKAFNEHLRNIKSKGAIDYTVHLSSGQSKVYGFKFFKQELIKVYNNGQSVTTKEDTKVTTKEKTITAEQMLEEELMPAVDHNAMEEMSEEEIEEVIAKCDTIIHTNKTLLNLPEAKYNYFIASLKGRDNLPLGLRKYQ